MKNVEIIQHKLITWWQIILELVPNIILCIIFLVFFLFVSKFAIAFITRVLHSIFPQNTNKNTALLLSKLAKYIIYALGTYVCLEILHLGSFMAKFIGSLGIAGIIAGVALKDLVTSIFAGFLINFEKSFEIGDTVTISNTKGIVEDIGFLTTKLKTEEGEFIFVPNQLIFNSPFINHNKEKK